MTNTEPSRMNANANIAAGAVKETMGNLVGNREMAAKGNLQNTEGHAEYKAAQNKQYADGVKDQVVGGAKQTFGGLTNDSTEAEGKLQREQGNVKKDMSYN
ncbi:hypothetical protein MP228_000663 [Amoeboaphelidium protococcarum]|nr:hypothetical protein MP228_012366 [Amoeboaphelidium protococcarum]KAI3654609.1 hypothetical protein MP228_000663 [Amoeboaphelidium protococcarum]